LFLVQLFGRESSFLVWGVEIGIRIGQLAKRHLTTVKCLSMKSYAFRFCEISADVSADRTTFNSKPRIAILVTKFLHPEQAGTPAEEKARQFKDRLERSRNLARKISRFKDRLRQAQALAADRKREFIDL
jgi:hypothetical protein